MAHAPRKRFGQDHSPVLINRCFSLHFLNYKSSQVNLIVSFIFVRGEE
jgi:hypothetical protein